MDVEPKYEPGAFTVVVEHDGAQMALAFALHLDDAVFFQEYYEYVRSLPAWVRPANKAPGAVAERLKAAVPKTAVR